MEFSFNQTTVIWRTYYIFHQKKQFKNISYESIWEHMSIFKEQHKDQKHFTQNNHFWIASYF